MYRTYWDTCTCTSIAGAFRELHTNSNVKDNLSLIQETKSVKGEAHNIIIIFFFAFVIFRDRFRPQLASGPCGRSASPYDCTGRSDRKFSNSSDGCQSYVTCFEGENLGSNKCNPGKLNIDYLCECCNFHVFRRFSFQRREASVRLASPNL